MEQAAKWSKWLQRLAAGRKEKNKPVHPFWVIVHKEITDTVTSWRFLILVGIMLLTSIGSLYTAFSGIRSVDPSQDGLNSFLFLKLFTLSDGTMPNFITFISFLGPLLGIGLGFDAVNSERNKGTLSRIMSQPIHRDYIINAKFTAALIIIAILFFGLGFVTMGLGLFNIGIPPTPEEFLRLLAFLALSVFYVAFWLNLAILFSVRFRQPATSALSGIGVWLFFSVFYSMIINLIGNALAPSQTASTDEILGYAHTIQFLSRLSPSQLFSDATQTLLMPETRALGLITYEQAYGALPGPLPLGQSLLLVWPQLTGLIAATLICFAIAYVWFMRQEIRSR
ncbi:MAG TPA: ABC transporter permease [Bacilli bacterium]